MTQRVATIRSYVDVRRHPTVVRLLELDANSPWLTDSFVRTPEVDSHLQALQRLLASDAGSGVFLVGHYGSGKSHFLAYLALLLRARPKAPQAVAVSLVNFSSANRLEDIVAGALGVTVGEGDRRPAWDAMIASHPHGVVLLLDELSELLRAKSSAAAFSEDVRFLQFLGEWAPERRFWIIAAMQESIEHTGELESGLYRKIKDRYPLRLMLTPTHVQTLIAEGILVKKPEYQAAVGELSRQLQAAYPDFDLDFRSLQAVYPLHPATLTMLEEVRDRFSQARGVVDFTVTRLLGDPTRGVEPFLDRPFGSLITPDAIVDHFRDLLELQPEFLPLAQQLLPWYEHHLGEMFAPPALRELAEKVLRLLILVHLSPARESLTAREAAGWLLLGAARIDPERNLKVIEKILATLVERGRYVAGDARGYRLDLRDDSNASLERALGREVAALEGQDGLVLEMLVPLIPPGGFNPFLVPRDEWQQRRALWHFYERRFSVWIGHDQPPPPVGLGIRICLPWGETTATPGLYCVIPAAIRVTGDLIELAALTRLREQPQSPELMRRIQQRIEARVPLLQQVIRAAWQDARLITPEGNVEAAPRVESQATFDSWLETVAVWVLRRIYPAFERFAPVHGPLPKEAWLQFMRFASKEDIGLPLADQYVRLIREAYLVPMGLLRRKGQEYLTPPNLDRNELVQLIAPLLENNPTPKAIAEHCAQPIYGLVPDQVNLLLVFLSLQGEIDIRKGSKSYRDSFETLPNPSQYDRVVPGHALSAEQLSALERLCQGLAVATPAHWSVLTQRRCAALIADAGRRQIESLQPLAQRLADSEQGVALGARLQEHIRLWDLLVRSDQPLRGLEQLLFAISSAAAFADDVRTFRDIGERVDRLLAETRRFTHLFAHPTVRRLQPANVGAAPMLDQLPAVETWLQAAARLYEEYRNTYSELHEQWWRNVEAQPIWNWSVPAMARSRHLDLGEALAEVESCRREAESRRCRGLVNLDFQPQCTCGFDGSSAPIADSLARLAEIQKSIDASLQQFFQLDRVKTQLRDWQRQGIEMNAATLAYLDGARPIPEIGDLAAFDDFLAGIDLAAEIELSAVVELLTKRVWRIDELMRELHRWLGSAGAQRARFVGSAQSPPPALLDWCARQVAQYAEPLPEGLTRQQRAAIADALRPQWITALMLQKLETLGLDEAALDRVAGWLLSGQVGLPEGDWSNNAVLVGVAELLQPTKIDSPDRLASTIGKLYRGHERMMRVASAQWLAHLDQLARLPLADIPPLPDVLRPLEAGQWLLIDCFGLPFLAALQPTLLEALADWQLEKLDFAQVAPPTTTDGCYRALLAADINHAFEKIDALDNLIHEHDGGFAELVELARIKLAAAGRALAVRLDPKCPIVAFGDHGFRLTAGGRGYVHGGPSSLERIVPVWTFSPRKA